jgi:predicted Zn-dependent protease
MLLGKARRYDEAQRQLEACVAASPAFGDAQEFLGELLLARNQPAEAAGRFQEAVRLRPQSPRANFGLGMALAATGNRAQAIGYLKKAATVPEAAALLKELEAQRE